MKHTLKLFLLMGIGLAFARSGGANYNSGGFDVPISPGTDVPDLGFRAGDSNGPEGSELTTIDGTSGGTGGAGGLAETTVSGNHDRINGAIDRGTPGGGDGATRPRSVDDFDRGTPVQQAVNRLWNLGRSIVTGKPHPLAEAILRGEAEAVRSESAEVQRDVARVLDDVRDTMDEVDAEQRFDEAMVRYNRAFDNLPAEMAEARRIAVAKGVSALYFAALLFGGDAGMKTNTEAVGVGAPATGPRVSDYGDADPSRGYKPDELHQQSTGVTTSEPYDG